jgi:hypothetical protein
MYKKEDSTDGVCYTLPNLLDLVNYRQNRGEYKTMFLITGKRVLSFREVTESVRELVVGKLLRMTGVAMENDRRTQKRYKNR